MTGIENQNQSVQRPRCSSPASKKDVIIAGSPKTVEKSEESAAKKIAPEESKTNFIKRARDHPRVWLSLLVSMLVMMVCLLGAYLDVAPSIPVGKDNNASLGLLAAPMVGAVSIFVCQKCLPPKQKAN